MAIIQISKLQQRSGNLVDLPQLSEAEFGWASDEKRLFIGKETPNENIEVLTSYSQIDFSQIEGAVGNLSISNANVANGQILAYNGTDWINRGGAAGGLINLGSVSNIKISGGAIDYVLTTDGLGNLSWTTKGGGGGGGGTPGGTIYSLQYNDGVSFAGDANIQWNFSTRVLSINGNTNTGNLSATGTVTASRLVSNITTGTAPLTVSSTTTVANLNADLLDGYDTSVVVSPVTVVVRDASGNIFANNVTIAGSIISGTNSIVIGPGSNVSITVASTERIRATTTGAEIFGNLLASNVYANTGTVGASLLTGTLTTAAQPNITSVGTLTSLAVTGNVTSGNVYANTGTIGASLLTGTLTTAAQPNITSVGTLTSLAVTGNITGANVTTSSYVIRSVGTAISAAGTIQGNATALTKDINVVSTVSAGQGVRLPTAVAGMVIIVNNASATNMNVYPATSAAINSLSTNAAYTHVAGASLQYYAISSSQWYTIGATYS